MKLLEQQPRRMAHEVRLLEELARSESWFKLGHWGRTASGDLCVNFQLESLTGQRRCTLVYPEYFPETAAYVQPEDTRQRWGAHQYGTGVLCLERGPDNWDPSVTGMDMVRSAYKLLWGKVLHAVVPDFPPVESREVAGTEQAARRSHSRFVLTSEFTERAAALQDGTTTPLVTVTTFAGPVSSTVPQSLGDGEDGALVTLEDAPPASIAWRGQLKGWLICHDLPGMAAAGATEEKLRTALGDAWPWTAPVEDALYSVVVRDKQNHIRAFYLSGGKTPQFTEHYVLDPPKVPAHARLPAKLDAVRTATVAIVGLGSLGSKLAVSLARSGIRDFQLFDEDILGQQNLVRNQLSWRHVGLTKVDAVGDEIRLVAPEAKVIAWPFGVGTQQNPQVTAKVAKALSECTLVIDATADSQAFLTLAAVCKRAMVPMVWGELFAGGFGGLMARSRPGKDAPAAAIRAHVLGAMGTLQPVPGEARKKSSAYAMDDGTSVYVGTDADITCLAGSMTQFALDTLQSVDETSYPVAAYLMGYRKFWEFKQPFDTIPIDCTGAMAEAQESTSDELSSEDQKVVAILLSAAEQSEAARAAMAQQSLSSSAPTLASETSTSSHCVAPLPTGGQARNASHATDNGSS